MDLKEFNFKKKFGQNFLIDDNILKKIINVSDIRDNSLVLEIGCGSGNLTYELCKISSMVIGYEIDKEVSLYLEDKLKDFNNKKIIYKDFLVDDISYIKDYDFDNLYVVANVPYYITTPIIEKIINSGIDPKKIVLMVQKEVGDRFSAKPGSREYGSISVYLNYYYNIKKEFVVSRNCFYPKPNVDSVIISFSKKDKLYNVNDKELFFKLVRDSFKYKRKTLRNNLKGYDLDKIEKVLLEYGFDLSVRAENLDVKVFCDMANVLSI